MRAQNELLDAIQVLIDKSLKDKATKVTGGKVKSASGGRAVITINGYDYPIPYSGDAPKVGSTVRVFIPNGNMSDAFIGGGGGTTIVLSASQPSGLKAGDYWYQIVT